MKKLFAILLTALAVGFAGGAAAQDAPATVAPVVEEAVAAVEAAAEAVEAAVVDEVVVDKGDVAWLMTATLLVLFMALPGLALFYGGMVRAKNMLSVLMQVMVVF